MAQGGEKFEPEGHDVVFDHVAFGYGAGEDGRAGEKVLTDVSFTAKEGEVPHSSALPARASRR